MNRLEILTPGCSTCVRYLYKAHLEKSLKCSEGKNMSSLGQNCRGISFLNGLLYFFSFLIDPFFPVCLATSCPTVYSDYWCQLFI